MSIFHMIILFLWLLVSYVVATLFPINKERPVVTFIAASIITLAIFAILAFFAMTMGVFSALAN